MSADASSSAPALGSGSNYSRKKVWYVVLLLALVNAFNYLDRMALSALLPLIKADMHLTDAQLGLLVGVAFALFYAVCGLPIARWADRGVRRDIVAIALAVWSVMTMASGAAQNFWHLFLARVGVGAGEAGCLPPSQSLLCDYIPVRRRAGYFAIHNFGPYLGMIVGMGGAGWLGQAIGWRWTFVVLGLPGVLLALVVRATLREPERGAMDAVQTRRTSFAEVLAFIVRSRTFVLLNLYAVFNGFALYGVNQWLPTFYIRVFGMDLASAGLSVGLITGAGSGTGLLVGGWLASRQTANNIGRPFKWGAVAIALAFPALVAALLVDVSTLSMGLLLVGAVLWGVPGGANIAGMYSVVPAAMRATAGSISIFLTSVVGFGGGPLLVGLISDVLAVGQGAASLRYALLVPLAAFPVMVIALALASRTVQADVDKLS